jgi:hypothetical protein
VYLLLLLTLLPALLRCSCVLQPPLWFCSRAVPRPGPLAGSRGALPGGSGGHHFQSLTTQQQQLQQTMAVCNQQCSRPFAVVLKVPLMAKPTQ